MSNDAGSDAFYRELAQETWNDSEAETRKDGSILFTRTEVATRTLADALKDSHEDQQAELTQVSGVFADLLTAALSEVLISVGGRLGTGTDKPEIRGRLRKFLSLIQARMDGSRQFPATRFARELILRLRLRGCLTAARAFHGTHNSPPRRSTDT
ncbi:MAG: hypothetical protein DMG30_24640 [Acidobacteria bacterium]|nr:MAG: hypothetical protein DMG30_24640 [Acidobacteriota bacterium]